MAVISTVPSAVAGGSGTNVQAAQGAFAGNSALSGLFSMLMGFGEGAEGQEGGLLGALLSGDAKGDAELLSLLQKGGEGAEDFAALFEQIEADLAGLAKTSASAGLESQAETEGLVSLLGKVQQAIQGLKQAAANGEITVDLTEKEEALYIAFKEMGYPPQKAQDMAKQLEAAFDKLKQAQKNGTDLQALLENSADDAAASALVQAGVQAEQSRVVQVSQTIEIVASQQGTAAFQAQAKQAPVVNLAEKIHSDQPLITEATPHTVEASGQNTVEPEALPAQTKEEVKTHSHTVAERGAVAEKPALFGDNKTNQTQAVATENTAEDGTVSTQTERAVKAPSAVEGQTMYQWKQTAAGMDVLEQMPDAPRTGLMDGVVVEGLADEAHEVAEAAKTASGKQASFAEKMAEMARTAQLGNQVQPAVKTLLAEGGGTVRVSLNPAELGEIEVELELKDGTVHGKIAAQNAEVIEQLARELHTLKQGFAEAGLTLGDDGIAFLLQNDAEGEGGQQFAEGEGEDEGPLGEKTEGEPNIAASQWTDPTRALDMRV